MEGEGIWEERGREGKGRGGEGGEGKGREGRAPPNILLHPQFQFSRNMPDSVTLSYLTKYEVILCFK